MINKIQLLIVVIKIPPQPSYIVMIVLNGHTDISFNKNLEDKLMKILVMPKPFEGISRESYYNTRQKKFKRHGNCMHKASAASSIPV